MAKLMNIWQARLKQVSHMWAKSYGKQSAQTHCRRAPSRCLGGRWGSITICENFVLHADFALVRVVFKQLLRYVRHKREVPEVAAVQDLADAVDEVALEEAQTYQARMSRWSKDVLQALSDIWLEVSCMVVNKCREPVDHYFSILKQVTLDNVDRSAMTSFAKLLLSDCCKIMLEFDQLAFAQDHIWKSIASLVDEDSDMQY